jgi:hypothetical protein
LRQALNRSLPLGWLIGNGGLRTGIAPAFCLCVAAVVDRVCTEFIFKQPVETNLSPFTFVETDEPASPFRFYRAVLAH